MSTLKVYNGATWDEIPTSFTYTHPSGDGNLHVPVTSTTNNGKFLRAGSEAGSLAWATMPTSNSTLYSLSSAFSSSITTLADVTEWSFSVTSGKIYNIEIVSTYQTSSTSCGGKMGVYLSSGTGTIHGFMCGGISASAVATELKIPIRAIGASNLTGSYLLTTAVSATSTPHHFYANMNFICATSGTFKVQWASELGNSYPAQINAGSAMIVTLLN